mmetsp:Transcript_63549/g.182487  ORF Transcript_63549/g.182487 Transcript_63549/m.182487 type:complete len:219 (+) Transcript_63549:80-736(+)
MCGGGGGAMTSAPSSGEVLLSPPQALRHQLRHQAAPDSEGVLAVLPQPLQDLHGNFLLLLQRQHPELVQEGLSSRAQFLNQARQRVEGLVVLLVRRKYPGPRPLALSEKRQAPNRPPRRGAGHLGDFVQDQILQRGWSSCRGRAGRRALRALQARFLDVTQQHLRQLVCQPRHLLRWVQLHVESTCCRGVRGHAAGQVLNALWVQQSGRAVLLRPVDE